MILFVENYDIIDTEFAQFLDLYVQLLTTCCFGQHFLQVCRFAPFLMTVSSCSFVIFSLLYSCSMILTFFLHFDRSSIGCIGYFTKDIYNINRHFNLLLYRFYIEVSWNVYLFFFDFLYWICDLLAVALYFSVLPWTYIFWCNWFETLSKLLVMKFFDNLPHPHIPHFWLG